MAGDDDDSSYLPLLFLEVSLVIGALVRSLVKSTGGKLPYTVVLMVIGVCIGAARFKSDTNLLGMFGRSVDVLADVDPHIILHVFLPALIFESAFSVNFHIMWREIFQALVLAGPGVVMATGLTACLAKFVFPYGWGWDFALMFGAIVSATDPVAVVATLRELGASKRLATLIEAESLLNDGTAFVVFILAKEFVVGPAPDAQEITTTFLRLVLGGVGLGLAFAFVATSWLVRIFNDSQVETVITIFSCYLVFFVAEGSAVHVSGVLAVVVLGLYLSRHKAVISPSSEVPLHHVWEMVSYIANTIIFILSGVIAGKRMFDDPDDFLKWREFYLLLTLYIGIQCIRLGAIYVLKPCLNGMGYGFTTPDMYVTAWGGLRGAVSLALALLVEGDTKIKDSDRALLVFHVSGLVGLTLLINGTTMRIVLHRLGMDVGNPTSQMVYKSALEHLKHEERSLVTSLKQDATYSGADWKKIQECMPRYTPERSDSILSRWLTGRSGTSSQVTALNTEDTASGAPKMMRMGTVRLVGSQRSPSVRSGLNRAQTNRVIDRPYSLEPEASAELELPVMHDEKQKMTIDVAELKRMVSNMGKSSEDDQKRLLRQLKDIADGGLKRLEEQESLSREVRHRFLSSMKASYWKQFEEGQVTREALALLLEASETALDTDEVRLQLKAITPNLEVPPLMRKMRERLENSMDTASSSVCPKPVAKVFMEFNNQRLFEHLSVGVEMATAFLTASAHVAGIAAHLPFGDLMDDDRNVVAKVVKEFARYERQIRTRIGEIRELYPEVYEAIQTRQVAQHVLHHARVSIHKLYADGLLEDTELKRMVGLVEAQMNRLEDSSFFAIGFTNSEDRLRQLPFMAHMAEEQKTRIIDQSCQKTFAPGEVVIEAGTIPLGIYVITRGVVHMYVYEEDGSMVSHQAAHTGLMLGTYSMLAGVPYLARAQASGAVETYFLSRKLISGLIRHDRKVEWSLWKMAGARLMKTFFKSEFLGLSAVSLAKMCEDARYARLNEAEAERLQLRGTALLLTGTVRAYTFNYREDDESLGSPTSSISSTVSNGSNAASPPGAANAAPAVAKPDTLSPTKKKPPSRHFSFDVQDQEKAKARRASTASAVERNLARTQSQQLVPGSDKPVTKPRRSRSMTAGTTPLVNFAEAEDDTVSSMLVPSRRLSPSAQMTKTGSFSTSRKRHMATESLSIPIGHGVMDKSPKFAVVKRAESNGGDVSGRTNGSNGNAVAAVAGRDEVKAKKQADAHSPSPSPEPDGSDEKGLHMSPDALLIRDKLLRLDTAISGASTECLSGRDNSDDENVVTVAPSILYPTHAFMEYEFSAGSRIIIFRESDVLKMQADKHRTLGLVPAVEDDLPLTMEQEAKELQMEEQQHEKARRLLTPTHIVRIGGSPPRPRRNSRNLQIEVGNSSTFRGLNSPLVKSPGGRRRNPLAAKYMLDHLPGVANSTPKHGGHPRPRRHSGSFDDGHHSHKAHHAHHHMHRRRSVTPSHKTAEQALRLPDLVRSGSNPSYGTRVLAHGSFSAATSGAMKVRRLAHGHTMGAESHAFLNRQQSLLRNLEQSAASPGVWSLERSATHHHHHRHHKGSKDNSSSKPRRATLDHVRGLKPPTKPHHSVVSVDPPKSNSHTSKPRPSHHADTGSTVRGPASTDQKAQQEPVQRAGHTADDDAKSTSEESSTPTAAGAGSGAGPFAVGDTPSTVIHHRPGDSNANGADIVDNVGAVEDAPASAQTPTRLNGNGNRLALAPIAKKSPLQPLSPAAGGLADTNSALPTRDVVALPPVTGRHT